MEKYYINKIPFNRIKSHTEKAKHYMYAGYTIRNGKERTLEDCYINYSKAKENAYYICDMLREQLDGFGKYIISYNDMFFTYAFITIVNGNEPYLIIMTAYNSYCIRLSREEYQYYIESGLQE